LASDEELFENGGETAMTTLVGRYERPLFRFLLHLVGDAHLAEDLFQEAFLRLHRARTQYKPGAPLKPYLYRIAINCVRDARARGRAGNYQSSKTPNGDSVLVGHANPASPDPKAEFQRSELKDTVRAAIAKLPEAERDVLIMRIYEELSFSEIAEITEVPVPTAKSRMLYALRRLRPVLASYALEVP